MKKMTKIAALLLGAAGCTVSVSASGIYDVSYDLATKNVTISGQTSTPNADVTLELLKAGKKGTDLQNINPSAADAVVSRYDQCVTDSDGKFEFVFKIPTDVATGNYVTRVAWGDKMNENQLIYISPADFADALLRVNQAQTTAEMVSAIDVGVNYFGFNNPYYANFKAEDKTFLAEVVIAGRPQGGYAGITDFGAVFIPASAVRTVAISADGDKALETVEFFDKELGISGLNSYSTFAKQKDSVKKEIALAVAKANPKTKAEIQTAFENKTVVYSLYRVAGYDAVYGILKDNNHLMNIDFSDYNTLSTKSNVQKKMTEKLFDSATLAATAFNEYVDAELNGTSGGSGGSSGGSGSGSSGGSGGTSGSSMVYTPQINNNAGISSGSTAKFNDLAGSEWAREAIESLAEQKIVSGKGNNEYDPVSSVKREEFVTMLAQALSIHNTNAKCNFNDTTPGNWYYTYVASAVEAGLVNGISEEDFGAGNDISKEDIASLLYRAATLKGKKLDTNGYAGFDDESEISGYALEAVKALNAAGIINGNGSGGFEPKKSASRAETAVMLYRFLNLFK